MKELKGKHGLKQESLIHFHRASLHTAFLFGKPQALTINLRNYLTSTGRSRELPLFSNLQSGGVIQRKWSIPIRWMIFREFLRSCLHGVWCEWSGSGVECSVGVVCESAADEDRDADADDVYRHLASYFKAREEPSGLPSCLSSDILRG
jgi:hypothetical protein